nr:MAG TPA: hypothetical protein [Caudoviricetes sp.]
MLRKREIRKILLPWIWMAVESKAFIKARYKQLKGFDYGKYLFLHRCLRCIADFVGHICIHNLQAWFCCWRCVCDNCRDGQIRTGNPNVNA